MWTRKKLLIVAKTYPQFSKTHLETVCTAAIEADSGRLVRVYPLSLRYMDQDKQPKEFDWVEVDVEKNPKDPRPESYRIRQDTIRILDRIPTDNGWRDRNAWVFKAGSNEHRSLEQLHHANTTHRTSLGFVRPKRIDKVYAVEKTRDDFALWEKKRLMAVSQHELFGAEDVEVRELSFPWIEYRVCFHCDDATCKGHDLSVHDWGMYVLDMKMTKEHGTREAEQKVKDKLLEVLDPEKKDARLLLGNTLANPSAFIIGGIYYPPRQRQGAFDFLQVADPQAIGRLRKQVRQHRAVAARRVGLKAE